MLKAFVWSAAAAMSGAAAIFVPIDPEILHVVGVADEAAGTPQATRSVKIVAAPGASTKSAVNGTSGARFVSPYGAFPNGQPAQPVMAAPRPARVGRLAIATPPVKPATSQPAVVKPSLAEPAAPAPVAVSVIRALQAELRRVGCYRGRVDGDWGPASRFAMASFVSSINAALPSDRPDTILLSLVRRHPGNACGVRPSTPPGLATAKASPLVPKARVSKVSGWQTRVSPTIAQTPRRAKPRTAPIRLTGVPRIVRSGGSTRSKVAVSDPFARSRTLSRPFGESRMSLGVAVPAPTEARRPITAPRTAGPSSYNRRSTRIRRAERRRARRAQPRARRASAKRRRYYRRRARSRNWRRSVFPGVYN